MGSVETNPFEDYQFTRAAGYTDLRFPDREHSREYGVLIRWRSRVETEDSLVCSAYSPCSLTDGQDWPCCC
jgi:hypothetical protein